MSDLEFVADLKHLRYIGVYVLYLIIKATLRKSRTFRNWSMTEYLHYALRDHPRTRRLGELITDLTYPITSSVLNSGYIPFPGALLRGVDHLKQTSDYIFQTPYERLVLQIEESRQLRENLEGQLLSTEEEYQCLRCSQNASEMEVLRNEHSLAIQTQRSSFQSQLQELQSQINQLNSRIEALLDQLTQRDEENSSLKVSLVDKEEALAAAVTALEAIRAENKARDEQALREKEQAEEEARNRPTIDTTNSYDRQHGILTPHSDHLRQSSLPMTDVVGSGAEPAQVAAPSEDGSLVDVAVAGLDQDGLQEKEPVTIPESIPETSEKPVVIVEPAEEKSEETVAETIEKQKDVEPLVVDSEPKVEPAAPTPAEEGAQQPEVNIVVETSDEGAAPSQEVTTVPAPTVGENHAAEPTNPPEVDPASEQVKDKEAKDATSSPSTSDVDVSQPKTSVSPATPERSPSPASSIPGSGKHSKQSSGYHGAYSSFAYGGPDFFKSNAEPLSPDSNGSARKKRHSFFGRHEAPHAEKDKDDAKDKERPSLRSRVFSSHTHSHSVSHPKSKSDEESSINSLENAKKVNHDRPDSPDSIGKLARRHSRFETYIVDPLERKASQVVRKGRELLRHESHHSLHQHPDHEHSQ